MVSGAPLLKSQTGSKLSMPLLPNAPSKAAQAPAPQQALVPVADLPSGYEEHAHDGLDVIQKIYPYVLRTCLIFSLECFARAWGLVAYHESIDAANH